MNLKNSDISTNLNNLHRQKLLSLEEIKMTNGSVVYCRLWQNYIVLKADRMVHNSDMSPHS